MARSHLGRRFVQRYNAGFEVCYGFRAALFPPRFFPGQSQCPQPSGFIALRLELSFKFRPLRLTTFE